MKLSRTEKIVVAVNVGLVGMYCAWSVAALFGYAPVFACSDVARDIEIVLAMLNLPSWGLGILAWELAPDPETKGFIVRQLVWTILAWPQWWLFVRLSRLVRRKPA